MYHIHSSYPSLVPSVFNTQSREGVHYVDDVPIFLVLCNKSFTLQRHFISLLLLLHNLLKMTGKINFFHTLTPHLLLIPFIPLTPPPPPFSLIPFICPLCCHMYSNMRRYVYFGFPHILATVLQARVGFSSNCDSNCL
jgi:hypothetical protein